MTVEFDLHPLGGVNAQVLHDGATADIVHSEQQSTPELAGQTTVHATRPVLRSGCDICPSRLAVRKGHAGKHQIFNCRVALRHNVAPVWHTVRHTFRNITKTNGWVRVARVYNSPRGTSWTFQVLWRFLCFIWSIFSCSLYKQFNVSEPFFLYSPYVSRRCNANIFGCWACQLLMISNKSK